MPPQLTTLDPVPSLVRSTTILAKEGYHCSVIILAPRAETAPREAREVEEHLLIAVEGDVTVRFGDINTMLRKEAALLVPKGTAHLISAAESGAKILRVDVPPRQVVTPQILTLDRQAPSGPAQ
jgi:quercetin dioxygenase-like cupin family protein